MGNRNDTFAVAMRKDSVTVGHVPRVISPICSIFLRQSENIKCRVTGNRQCSSDLPQGGLELPCILTFSIQDQRESSKTEKLISDSLRLMKGKLVIELQSPEKDNNSTSNATKCNTSTGKDGSGGSCNTLTSHGASSSSTNNTGSGSTNNTDGSCTNLSTSGSGSSTTSSCTNEAIVEVIDLETADDESPKKKKPLCIDTHLIIMGEKLTDIEINHCQKMLKLQFPKLNGLRSTLQQDKPSNEPTTNWVQIVHCPSRDHWITATTIGCNNGMVKIYDSIFQNIDEPTKQILYKCFPSNTHIIVVGKTQKQVGEKDCGIFAIAFSTSSALGIDIEHANLHQDRMRLHLARCFLQNKLILFPMTER